MSGSVVNFPAVLETHLGLTPETAGPIRARTLRSIVITEHATPQSHWQWQDAIDDPYVAILFAAGQGADRAQHLRAWFLPAAPGMTIRFEASRSMIAVWFPLRELRSAFKGGAPHPRQLLATPLLQGLHAFAHALAHDESRTATTPTVAVERLFSKMVFGAVSEVFLSRPMKRDPDSLAERAYSVMLLNREDPRFTISTLATDLHISQRSLQRAFAEIGTTPRRVLQDLRIELAEDLLRSKDYSRLSIEELAFHSGFSSATRLRRALQASTLPNPAVIRARSGTNPAEPTSGSAEESASGTGRDDRGGLQG